MTDWEIIHAMLVYGGSFVQALARAWQAADQVNQYKLKRAFPELWELYADMAFRASRQA